MNNKNINIIDSIVNQDLCVGCGACLYQTQSNNWKMDWNNEGFLVPTVKNGECQINEAAINVCPFNPYPADEVRTEDELANIFLKDASSHHPQVGSYYNTYVGYSEQYRLTSSSGGLATYILSELFEQKIVDAVITVGEGSNNHYEYKLIKRKEDLQAASKTKYYPVTMAEALNELKSFDGKVAVVGIGCFIKAVRLLQLYNPELREKIVFTIGIICGGMKSSFFTEYLASKANVKGKFIKPQFRIKDLETDAGDYSFGCIEINNNQLISIKMKEVGNTWGTGFFKANACDFCDDVTTELADVSLGDAWISPYIKDARGTNILISRSKLAEKILKDGLKSNKINIEELDLNNLIKSQQGSYNHRKIGINYRINYIRKKRVTISPKRINNKNILFLDFRIVQLLRMRIRKLSLDLWKENRDAQIFDRKIKTHLDKLERMTKFYHYRRAFFSKNIFQKIIIKFLR